MSDSIRVLIVDDDALVRSGLQLMLAGAAGIDVVGEVADGRGVWVARNEGDQPSSDGRREHTFARTHKLDRPDNFSRRRVFDQEAGCARTQRPQHELVLLERRQHEHRRRPRLAS